MEEESAIAPAKTFLYLLNWSWAGIILHPENIMRKVSIFFALQEERKNVAHQGNSKFDTHKICLYLA